MRNKLPKEARFRRASGAYVSHPFIIDGMDDATVSKGGRRSMRALTYMVPALRRSFFLILSVRPWREGSDIGYRLVRIHLGRHSVITKGLEGRVGKMVRTVEIRTPEALEALKNVLGF